MIKRIVIICIGSIILSSCLLTAQQDEEIIADVAQEAAAIANSENSSPVALQKTDKKYYQSYYLESI